MKHAALLSVLSVALVWSFHARAAYPEEPVRIIVPFSTGGGTDIQARLLADAFYRSTGQDFHRRQQTRREWTRRCADRRHCTCGRLHDPLLDRDTRHQPYTLRKTLERRSAQGIRAGELDHFGAARPDHASDRAGDNRPGTRRRGEEAARISQLRGQHAGRARDHLAAKKC